MSQLNFEIDEQAFQEFLAVAEQIAEAETDDFFELAKLIGRDPKTDFAGADLRGVNLRNAKQHLFVLPESFFSRKFSLGLSLGVSLVLVFVFPFDDFINFLLLNVVLGGSMVSIAILMLSNHTLAILIFRFIAYVLILVFAALCFFFFFFPVGRNLHNANLSNTNLINVDLSNSDLRKANLSHSNLSGANLSNSDLRKANFSHSNLSGANLNSANVANARFDFNSGLTDSQKNDLAQRGAIFQRVPDINEFSLLSALVFFLLLSSAPSFLLYRLFTIDLTMRTHALSGEFQSSLPTAIPNSKFDGSETPTATGVYDS